MKNNFIDKKKIEDLLPHREPMLLIDEYSSSKISNSSSEC